MTDVSLTEEQLRELSRRGRDELGRLDAPTAASIWAAVDAAADATDDVPSLDAHRTEAGPAPSVPAIDARRPAPRWLAAVAGLALLVGGIGIGTQLQGDPAPSATTLASIQLDALDDTVDPTAAVLVDTPAGRTIQLDLAGVTAPEGHLEVWLLDPETGALVSLGPARGDGTYVVPDSVDLVALRALDVSVEPDDGDPTHSGASLLRGEVRWTG